ncbi:uncharacterized protein LOC125829284 [Solanum verrucosum]|uniref:uncharacterized protein LOC125829284 n=1 Tax=Solanum verrucosum TaxID=315347 RepID=UPI0020D1EB97|nr:uncharacterized protein LOC125829284 [Solanum verrucosum]
MVPNQTDAIQVISPIRVLHDIVSHNLEEGKLLVLEDIQAKGVSKVEHSNEEMNYLPQEADLSPKLLKSSRKGKQQASGVENQYFDITVVKATEQQLTLCLKHHHQSQKWLITLVYAKCNAEDRLMLWEDIYQLSTDMDSPWLIGGDFNVVLNAEEKIGGLPIHDTDHEDFDICIHSCELAEIQFKGSPFTWWTGRTGMIVVVRQNWVAKENLNPFILFKENIRRVKNALSKWSKETYGDIFKQLVIREDIVKVKEQLFEEVPSVENRAVLQKAQAEHKKYLYVEETFWRQKVGFDWFGKGDRNTRFFHSIVKGRRKRHQLNRIQESQEEENEDLCRDPTLDEVKRVVFSLNGDSAGGPDGLTNFVNRSIIENVLLTQEIVTAIKKRGKPSNVIFKLDMAKAYDGVSWFFLMKVLRKMGFTESFVDLIWRLLANNWYSVLINGQSHGFFHSTRGVKWGDPLSPALFILSAQVLSRALNALFEDSPFQGYGMPK